MSKAPGNGSDKSFMKGQHTHPSMYDNVTEDQLDAILNAFDVPLTAHTDENNYDEHPDFARYYLGNGNNRNGVPMVDARRF